MYLILKPFINSVVKWRWTFVMGLLFSLQTKSTLTLKNNPNMSMHTVIGFSYHVTSWCPNLPLSLDWGGGLFLVTLRHMMINTTTAMMISSDKMRPINQAKLAPRLYAAAESENRNNMNHAKLALKPCTIIESEIRNKKINICMPCEIHIILTVLSSTWSTSWSLSACYSPTPSVRTVWMELVDDDFPSVKTSRTSYVVPSSSSVIARHCLATSSGVRWNS